MSTTAVTCAYELLMMSLLLTTNNSSTHKELIGKMIKLYTLFSKAKFCAPMLTNYVTDENNILIFGHEIEIHPGIQRECQATRAGTWPNLRCVFFVCMVGFIF